MYAIRSYYEPAKFSRSQRECLALLVAAPDGQIDQEALQLLFWPDSSPEKGRSNLDTMLSRLRKTLQDRIAPLQAKDYLKLQKGTIVITSYSIHYTKLYEDRAVARRQRRSGNDEAADAQAADYPGQALLPLPGRPGA